MRSVRLVIMMLAASLAAGCASHPPPPVSAQVAMQSGSELDTMAYGVAVQRVAASPGRAGGESPYTLDAGDKLRVVVFGQDGLTNSYGVDAGGNITMPLIGAVAARGKTTAELSAAISARLRDGYIREPHVAVEVEAYRPFFILGEVTYPGQYPYVANMTVETAVAIAGGFTPRALHDRMVISRTMGGQAVRITVPAGTPVRPGDTVTVDERWF